MKFFNITTEQKKIYTLKANEKCVFFLFNRPGDITFRLAGAGAESRIFALFSLSKDKKIESRITQIHAAPNTKSSLVGRSILSGRGALNWQGLVKIHKKACGSDGHQEMRNLLLSPEASALTIPSLEIDNNDVRCGHAATTSTPNKEALFFLQSRGFSHAEAERILIEGFVRDILERLPASDTLKEALLQSIFQTL